MGQSPATASRTLKRYRLTDEQAASLRGRLLMDDLEHQTIVTLKPTPFRGSIRISDSPPLFLEECDVTLEWIISRRLGSEKMVPQQDITKLIESCIYGLAFLQKKGIQVPLDVHPSNIFFYRDKRVWKMANPQLVTPGYQQIATRFSALPPEHIHLLRLGQRPEPNFKSNIFSLGIVLLEATSLEPMSNFYHPQNYSLLESKIESALKNVENYYSELTVKAISLMLIYDPASRMDPIELSLFFHNELNIKPLIQSTAFVPKPDHPPFSSQIIYHERPRVDSSPPPQNYMGGGETPKQEGAFNPFAIISAQGQAPENAGSPPGFWPSAGFPAEQKAKPQAQRPNEQVRIGEGIKHTQVASVVYGQAEEQPWESAVSKLRADIQKSRLELSQRK